MILFLVRGKKKKTRRRHREGKREARGITVVSPTIRFDNVLLNFWSRFTYLLSQFPNSFRLISVWKKSKNEVHTCVSHFFTVSLLRERNIYMRNARFASWRNKHHYPYICQVHEGMLVAHLSWCTWKGGKLINFIHFPVRNEYSLNL